MIRAIETEDNPVTWDDVTIEHIGPSGPAGPRPALYLNHRAMIEEICSGTHLSPFLLGYSYNATTNWRSSSTICDASGAVGAGGATSFLNWLPISNWP